MKSGTRNWQYVDVAALVYTVWWRIVKYDTDFVYIHLREINYGRTLCVCVFVCIYVLCVCVVCCGVCVCMCVWIKICNPQIQQSLCLRTGYMLYSRPRTVNQKFASVIYHWRELMIKAQTLNMTSSSTVSQLSNWILISCLLHRLTGGQYGKSGARTTSLADTSAVTTCGGSPLSDNPCMNLA